MRTILIFLFITLSYTNTYSKVYNPNKDLSFTLLSINQNQGKKFEIYGKNSQNMDISEFSLLNIKNDALKNLFAQKSYKIVLENDKSYEIIPLQKKIYSSDIFTVIGYFKKFGQKSEYFIALTFSPIGLLGDFYLPDGHYQIDINNGRNVLLKPNYFKNHAQNAPFINDQDIALVSNKIQNYDLKFQNKAKIENTQLNVAIIISESVGDYISAKAHMISAFNLGQAQLTNSGVNITLNLKLIAPVKSEFDINLNDNIQLSNETFHIEGLNMVDLESENTETFPSLISEFNIHHFVLAIGSSTIDINCGFSGSPRGYDNFSTYRLGSTSHGVCPKVTLIHEIGHNLTLIHEDGACTTFDIGSAEVCKLVDPPPPDVISVITDYDYYRASEREWRTVMRSSGKAANFFTGGLENSIDSPLCNGSCNVEPFEDHDSIGILNQARFTAVNNYIEVVMPIVPPTTNPDVYEDDDISSQSIVIDLNETQHHNFSDDVIDWLEVSVPGFASLELPVQRSILINNTDANINMCALVYYKFDGSLYGEFCNLGENSTINLTGFGLPKTYLIKLSNNFMGNNTNYTINLFDPPFL